jgi:acyl-CoA synthetase (AMP-forming)/AMP-acid ligase II
MLGRFGRGDRVAIVLPNCLRWQLFMQLLLVHALPHPLNMAYTAADFEFYLGDIHASAVVIAKQNGNQIAADVANRLGIRILWLETQSQLGVGRFSLTSDVSLNSSKDTGPAQSEDVALILHTSGTTSRPKIVPLLHRNVVASANNIRQSLHLTSKDRGLHVMPMFLYPRLSCSLIGSLVSRWNCDCDSWV